MNLHKAWFLYLPSAQGNAQAQELPIPSLALNPSTVVDSGIWAALRQSLEIYGRV